MPAALEAVVVVGREPSPSEADLEAVRALGGAGVSVLVVSSDGSVLATVTS